jgi:cell division protein FtsA
VIHGSLNRLQNAIRTVKGLQLEVDDIVFNGLACSLALLTNEQKELGSLVIDLGGGTTEYVVYTDGIVKHTGVLAVGGDHVSNDLAYGLKVPLSRAEQLKLEHGSVLAGAEAVQPEAITLPSDVGLPVKTLHLGNLRRIALLRVEEIFELVLQDLEQVGAVEYLRAGAFLCGGTSRMPGIAAVAERILRLPVTLGRTNSISGLKSALDQPEFATGIGLVKFGSFQQRRKAAKGSFAEGIKSTFGQFFKRS